MLKAAARGKDGEVALIGLSHKNIEELMKGRPIKTSCEFLGIKGTLLIIVGKDELEMAKMLEPYIGENTKIHIDEKLKS